MIIESVWKIKDGNKPRFESLKGYRQCDVLVIGGGICGILCANELKKRGVDCILIEADRILGGVTLGTTAKITAQHGLIYCKMLKMFGKEKTEMYLRANLDALECYREMCKGIDCDFEAKDSYVYSKDSFQKIEKELRALETVGFSAEYADDLKLPISTKCAVRFKNQAQFDPIKFLSEVAKGLDIYENTRALSYDGNYIITQNGRIKAKSIIVATHFPIFNKHGFFYLKMYQHRSYVLALKNAQKADGMYIDENKTGFSFRDCNDMLLLGGGSHRTGKKGGGWSELEAFAHEHYPDSEIVLHQATQDCMTLDSVPYIGRYSLRSQNLYVATGFNKWGMTSSMAAAKLLADMISGKDDPYYDVFSPQRSILRPQLAINGYEAVTNILNIKKPKCPHLGCTLKWNAAERSWDCPCHGSRFDFNGRLLDNPANGDCNDI